MVNRQKIGGYKKEQFYKMALLNGEVLKIEILLNPITKKNSSQIIMNKKTGKPFIVPSKQFKRYENECGLFLTRYRNLNIDIRVNVKCIYYMKKRYKVDLNNLLESTTDVLVNYGVLEDDNSSIVAGHDGSRVMYSKDNPRTEIYISYMNDD